MGKLDADYKKVGKFLKGLTEVEFRYLELCMNFVSGIQSLINKYKLEKDAIVDLFEIKSKDYYNYISGNYDYSIKDVAMLNAAYIKLDNEKTI